MWGVPMKEFNFSKIAFTVASLLAVPSLSFAADAQPNTPDEDAEKGEKMVITGSRIKRTDAEGSLPVTIITQEDMQEQGIVTAEQLMMHLNINGNGTDNLASNVGITHSDNRGNNGFSGANLRGQGASSTLVLLNGRRVATHGMKGRAVDINSIPFAAIQRVEILRDGASAVYGTDAIGGVMNFIMKDDYQGIEVSAFTDITEQGGGDISRLSIVGGFGDLYNDGYNWLTTLTIRENKLLKGTDRDFTNTFQPNRGLSPDTRGPAFGSINDRWSNPNDPASGHYNLIGSGLIDPNTGQEAAVLNILDLPGGIGCGSFDNQGPYSELLWNSPTSEFACAWDYPRAGAIRQPVDSINIVSKATFKVGDDHQVFAELVASEVTSEKVFEPLQITPWSLNNPDHWYPSTGSSYQMIVDALSDFFGAGQLNIGAPIAYRWRCIDCGPRQIETTTEASRFLVGMNGIIGDWDYEVAFSTAESKGKSKLSGGYYFTDELTAVLGSGDLNPFLLPGQSQTQAGLSGLAAASATGTVLFGGKSTLKSIDGSITGDTGFFFDDREISVATGFDFRQEGFEFAGDQRSPAAQRSINGAPFDNGNELDKVTRDIMAVYVEALFPVTEKFELTAALRYDDYDGFGSTTNPKVSVTYHLSDEVLFRGAYNTGFRVPSFNQLFDDRREEAFTGQDLTDPTTCASGVVGDGPGCDQINPNIIQGGKEDLQPEESEQRSMGLVFAPNDSFSLNIDWWEINKIGTIQLPGLGTLVDNFMIFPDNFIRDANGRITAIDNRWVNAGERITSGIEIGARLTGEVMDGQWDIDFNGSHMIQDRSRLLENIPFSENVVGEHTRRNIALNWKHTVHFSWAADDWRHTLTQLYRGEYFDEVPVGIAAGVVLPPDWNPIVDSYIIYNFSTSYTGFEDMSVTFGIKNLLDTDPPFTAHQNDFSPGAAFDPRIADPRGRAYTILFQYQIQ